MYKINQIRLEVGFDKSLLKSYLGQKLKIKEENIISCSLHKLSIDARDKSDLCYKASVVFDIEGVFDAKRYKNVEPYNEMPLQIQKWCGGKKHIVVVGSGPAGLFAGLRLVRAGAKVTILERGYAMEKRKQAVENLIQNGVLDTKSNIQFGEGGAGTFSDGKLNTGIKSPYIREVLKTFHEFGADENILYDARPHVGTDILSRVVVNMRQSIESLGGQVLFEHCVVDINSYNGIIKSVSVQTPEGLIDIPCDILVFAIGHSSRDTIGMLYDKKINFRQKPFSMGFRIEHLQSHINIAQYGDSDKAKLLPPADYHVVEHLENGRVVYSFCMCPGGVVVPAMSEEGTVLTNGMSYSDRNGINSNSALLVSVSPSDYSSSHPLAGIELQEKWERYAYTKSRSTKAIIQTVGDFLSGTKTTKLGRVLPSYKPGYKLGSVEDMLPSVLIDSIKTALPRIDKKVKGFASRDAILTGVETRSSAPYQVIRNDDMMTSIEGVYAIGEGAGFAGGIVSSAIEGIKCADIILKKNN